VNSFNKLFVTSDGTKYVYVSFVVISLVITGRYEAFRSWR